MVYQFLKLWVQSLIRYYYRSVHINGLEHVPKDVPLLIAMNHPAGFMEPIILASVFPRPLYFLVRADVFKKKWLRPLLVSTNQLPIWRKKDGLHNVKNNATLFKDIDRVLLDGKPLIIYIEGSTKAVKRLRPLQKGLSRMACSALSHNPTLPLHILPIGINYTYEVKPYAEVMLNIGQPIPAQPFYETYLEHPNHAYEQINAATAQAMKDLIVHFDDTSQPDQINTLLELSRSTQVDRYWPRRKLNSKRFAIEKQSAEYYNSLDSEGQSGLIQKIKNIKERLLSVPAQLDDLRATRPSLWHYLYLLVGFPLMLLGLIINAPFVLLGRYVAESQVKGTIFYSSIIACVSSMGMLFYYTVLTTIGSIWLGWKALLIFPIGLALGIAAHYYLYVQHNWKKYTRKKNIPQKIIDTRDAVYQEIQNKTA